MALLVPTLPATAAAPSAAAPVVAPAEVAWTPKYQGVDYAAFTLTDPRPMVCHVLRVNLNAEGVSLITNEDNGDRPEETDGAKTSTFVAQSGCQAAVNGAPFWPVHAEEKPEPSKEREPKTSRVSEPGSWTTELIGILATSEKTC